MELSFDILQKDNGGRVIFRGVWGSHAYGTATPESRPELFSILMEDFGPERAKTGKWSEVYPANMFIGNYIRLEMMSKYGEDEKLLQNIRGYFLDMARSTGTLWEKVDINGSLCHGFASHVIYWLDKLGYVK